MQIEIPNGIIVHHCKYSQLIGQIVIIFALQAIVNSERYLIAGYIISALSPRSHQKKQVVGRTRP